jgi:hypothetical protein
MFCLSYNHFGVTGYRYGLCALSVSFNPLRSEFIWQCCNLCKGVFVIMLQFLQGCFRDNAAVFCKGIFVTMLQSL